MMRRLFLFFFCFFPALAFCADPPIILEFNKVPVIQFVKAIYGEVLGRNFIISPDALAVDKVVSMKLDVPDVGQVLLLSSSVLSLSRLSARDENGVFVIDVARASESSLLADEAVEVYRPRYRQASYLRMLLSVVDKRAGSGFSSSVQVQAQGQGDISVMNNGVSNSSMGGNDDFIVLSGSREYMDKALSFLDKVDVPPLAVQIRAVLVEVSTMDDESFNIGLALNLLSSRLGVNLGDRAPGTDNSIVFRSASVDAFISAMAGDSRYNIITEPRLIVADGATGKITVGSEVPIRGAVSYDDNGNAIQSIDYRSSGVIMEVSPRIYRDHVSVRLRQQVSNFSTTLTSGIDSPTLIKRELETVVDMNDGQVIALAGLDEQKDSHSSGGLPFFRWLNSSKSKSHTQLMLLLEVKRI
jgi:type II secretory pathway component GspD/PulD (secretin)